MSWRINSGLEWGDADAAERVDETLVAFALGDVDLEDALQRLRDFEVRHGRADHLAQRRVCAARGAAERDLVPLLAALVDAEDADVPDGVVAAAVHAAGHLQLDLAQVVEVVEAVETLVDLLRDRDRGRVGERAEVE